MPPGMVVSAGRLDWRRTGEQARRLSVPVMVSPLLVMRCRQPAGSGRQSGMSCLLPPPGGTPRVPPASPPLAPTRAAQRPHQATQSPARGAAQSCAFSRGFSRALARMVSTGPLRYGPQVGDGGSARLGRALPRWLLMTGAGAIPGAARAAWAQLPRGHGTAGELSWLARQPAAGLLIAAGRAAWPASGRTEGLGASWPPDVPGPGMTGCCQLAQPARWVSVTWLTPPLSACRHSTPAACSHAAACVEVKAQSCCLIHLRKTPKPTGDGLAGPGFRRRLRPAAGSAQGREAVLERDAVHVPDVVAELAAERLVAGADEFERRTRIVDLQVDDSEVGTSTAQGGPATGTLGRADQPVQHAPSAQGDQVVHRPDRRVSRLDQTNRDRGA